MIIQIISYYITIVQLQRRLYKNNSIQIQLHEYKTITWSLQKKQQIGRLKQEWTDPFNTEQIEHQLGRTPTKLNYSVDSEKQLGIGSKELRNLSN